MKTVNKRAAIEATIATLAIFGALALIGGIMYLAMNYTWAQYGVFGAFVAFCVYVVWMHTYNESKFRQTASGRESIGG